MAVNYTSNPQGFPPITAPLVDENGRITQVWMRFFLNLQISSSGGTQEDVTAVLAELGYVFDQDPPDGNTAYLQDFELADTSSQDPISLILATVDPEEAPTMTNWLRVGAQSSRPAKPNVDSHGASVYASTDTGLVWVWNGSQYLQLAGATQGITIVHGSTTLTNIVKLTLTGLVSVSLLSTGNAKINVT